MTIPFIEYYMLSPNPYMKIRYSGTDETCSDLGDTNRKRFFPEITKEEYKNYVGDNRVFDEMLDLVQGAFQKWYDFDCTDVFLNNNYQKDFNSYAYIDKSNPACIHVDQLLETIILTFMLDILKWAKEMEYGGNENSYFIYLIFLMNELCIFGQLPAEDAKDAIMMKVADDQQIMNLASDCHWAIMVFTLAHEIAHVYQMKMDAAYWRKHPKEAEFDADAIAYDILLRLIMDKPEKNLVMEEYTYLAPMMYMDFFDLYYYTDSILYGTVYKSQTHPTPEERKDALFIIVDQEIYQLDTEEGNTVYQWFCWIYDLYKERLFAYKESGKLDHVIHDELRKRK